MQNNTESLAWQHLYQENQYYQKKINQLTKEIQELTETSKLLIQEIKQKNIKKIDMIDQIRNLKHSINKIMTQNLQIIKTNQIILQKELDKQSRKCVTKKKVKIKIPQITLILPDLKEKKTIEEHTKEMKQNYRKKISELKNTLNTLKIKKSMNQIFEKRKEKLIQKN